MHLRQLMLKLALRRHGREGVEEIGQLHATAHDLIGRAAAQLPAHEQAVLGMIEGAQCIACAEQAVAQRFEDAQVEQGEDFYLFGLGLAWCRQQLAKFDDIVHGIRCNGNAGFSYPVNGW